MSVNSHQEKKHCIKAKGKWNPEQQHRTNVPSLQSKHVVSESSVIISFVGIFLDCGLNFGGWK